jgi:hypothetical protein
VYPNGDVYEGEFTFQNRHGKGTTRHADGDVYTGEVRGSVRAVAPLLCSVVLCCALLCCAVLCCAVAPLLCCVVLCCVGVFGLSEAPDTCWSVRCPQYHEDQHHGFGELQLKNGELYKGSWRMGLKWGIGLYVYRSGAMYKYGL